MNLTVVTAPTDDVVTLDEAKAQLRVEGTDNDTYITALLGAARDYVEQLSHRALTPQRLRLKLDCFPAEILLPRPPALSIVSIGYVDSAGDEQSVGASLYQADLSGEPARIRPAYGASWPTARGVLNAVTVDWWAGYDNGASPYEGASVPPGLHHAIKLMVTHWYEQRAPVVAGGPPARVPMAAEQLILMHRPGIIA